MNNPKTVLYPDAFGTGVVEVTLREIPFNTNYKYYGPRDEKTKQQFEHARNVFEIEQNNPYIHPYTCGVNSNHENLVLRITVQGQYVYVCPTCGYVQELIRRRALQLPIRLLLLLVNRLLIICGRKEYCFRV